MQDRPRKWRVDWEAGEKSGVEWFDDFSAGVERLLAIKNDFVRKADSDIFGSGEKFTLENKLSYAPATSSDDIHGCLSVSIRKKVSGKKGGAELIFRGDVALCTYLGR